MNDPNMPGDAMVDKTCVNCGKRYKIEAKFSKTEDGKYCDDCFAPFIDDEAAWEGGDVQ